MAMMDELTRRLIGSAVWHSIRWMEARSGGEPYEIFSESDDAEKIGYRVTIERIPLRTASGARLNTTPIYHERRQTMNTIYRYELKVTDEQKVNLPTAHGLLSVAPGRSGYHIDLWASVKPSDHNMDRIIHIVGTGHPMPSVAVDFIGTAVMSDGLVWHVLAEPARY